MLNKVACSVIVQLLEGISLVSVTHFYYIIHSTLLVTLCRFHRSHVFYRQIGQALTSLATSSHKDNHGTHWATRHKNCILGRMECPPGNPPIWLRIWLTHWLTQHQWYTNRVWHSWATKVMSLHLAYDIIFVECVCALHNLPHQM